MLEDLALHLKPEEKDFMNGIVNEICVRGKDKGTVLIVMRVQKVINTMALMVGIGSSQLD